ncbi:MAG: cytochrome b N-terminal domain-containing protein [Armatimonadetes bacterium]|nr:cytochrome b N-terminal domain-containing protein [Armatimonadota bacterium]
MGELAELFLRQSRELFTQFRKSLFRTDFSDTERDRSQMIMGNVFLHLHPVKIPKHAIKMSFTLCMGGISFFLFLVLTFTGIMLMFYYYPTTDRAYYNMKDLEFVVSFGMLMRNLHRWSAHGMVISVIFHMARVFFTGAYKHPREFNWVVGVVLLVLTLLLSFTGYLLPWDQLALWAVTVGTRMAAATPVLGYTGPFSITTKYNDLRFLLLGGPEVGENALLRFYVLHCIVLPLVAAVFIAVHFWRIRKDGGISRPL